MHQYSAATITRTLQQKLIYILTTFFQYCVIYIWKFLRKDYLINSLGLNSCKRIKL